VLQLHRSAPRAGARGNGRYLAPSSPGCGSETDSSGITLCRERPYRLQDDEEVTWIGNVAVLDDLNPADRVHAYAEQR